jgi:uncharacterized membrane protein
MGKGRIEAFSDAVIAIIITIMVLELKVPHGADWSTLIPLVPVFISYVLSFLYLGIYWNNHHHMFQAAERVNGTVLWANLFLLFWLSLIPFVTGWMGENQFAPFPVALYGVDLAMAGFAYWILSRTLIAVHGRDSPLATAMGRDLKGWASLVIYLLGIAVSFLSAWVAFGLYVFVALMWLVPDRRIERVLARGA